MDIFFDRIAPLIVETRSKGVKDADIERTIGLPAHSINKWFTGKYKSYKNYLPQIATYFDVSVSYLLGEDKENPAPAEWNGIDEKTKQVISAFESLTEQQKDWFLAQLQGIAQHQSILDDLSAKK